MQKVLLIIDPFLRVPESVAINTISDLFSEIQVQTNSFTSHIEVFFPSHSKSNLKDYFTKLEERNKKVIGVISLGSYANVTDNLDWVNALGKDLKECVIEKSIPFLGICFSHQLFAWTYGANVDFVSDRENLPEKKYNEFREISISHPRLKSLLGNTNSFISKAKHEQEVKNIPSNYLELAGFSEHCQVEALVHKDFPAFSVQSHPEEFHESVEGWNFVRRFLTFFISNAKIKITTDEH